MSDIPVAPSPLQTTNLIRQRAIDAVLGQSGLNHAGLVAEIRRRFGALDVPEGALVREPVIEGAAPFETDGRNFGALSGTLLHSAVVDAIARPEAEPYRFAREALPYRHQIAAWEKLTASEPKSVLVSSGTGSGKTECFMMPLLHDLAAEAQEKGRLSGVRAIALYPLNALIFSQQERLRAWTRPFDGNIRFGLYNGLTPDRLRAADKRRVEQVEDRMTLRSDPPPILVTNVTMLEYMTVRRIDRPLIDNSRGRLRWIILDEAHSYVGSAAAEIALLIRRVLLTFGVTPAQVRFVATSATIGEGKDVTDELRRFLRDLSGVAEDRVSVIFGKRIDVRLPVADASPVLTAADLGDGDAIARNPRVAAFVRAVEERPLLWEETRRILGPTGQPTERVVDAVAAPLQAGGEPLIPLRVHNFLRAVPGLWSCLNPECAGSPANWPFGAIAVERVERCASCSGLVFEVLSCRECGEPYLDAVERREILQPRVLPADQDEFAAASDREEDDEPEDEAESAAPEPESHTADREWRIAVRPLARSRHALHIDPRTARVHDTANENTRELNAHDGSACGHCHAVARAGSPLLRPFRYGAPFLIGNAAPVLLEGVRSSLPEDEAAHLPARGHQLLSFTDSRQGTARFAANLQTSAERGFVRAFIYHSAQDSMRDRGGREAEAQTLREDIVVLEQFADGKPEVADMLARKRAQLAACVQPSIDGIPWSEVRSGLAHRREIDPWMRKVWRSRDVRFDVEDPIAFAEFLLLRELARRPRRANTAETLGLARLRFQDIDVISEHRLPAALRDRGHTIEDWRAFLYVVVDQVGRANFAIRADRRDMHWLSGGKILKSLLDPGVKAQSAREQVWPTVNPKGKPANVAIILERALGLNRGQREDRDTLNALLATAWDHLRPLFHKPGRGDYALDLTLSHIAPVTDAWECPVTRRVLTARAFGLTPYGHREDLETAKTKPVTIEMPRLPLTFPQSGDSETLRRWTETDPEVAALRERGIWRDIHDRAATLAPYLRAAEHSAQQPAYRLRRFESDFKAGEINILNCSTTMEMGVDIGSVSAVMMTNVPPALANYRQRVGRAGRRRQGYASALTYTRDTPLEREAFRDPQTYLSRQNRAPQVKLEARPIVQRHVNALLLARWFAGAGGEAMRTEAGHFFGCPAEPGAERAAAAPIETFLAWLDATSTVAALSAEIAQLTRGTILEHDRTVIAETGAAFRAACADLVGEWSALQQQAAQSDKAAASGIGYQLKRLAKENLLKELAVRAVLPGHGFPTDVVEFVNLDRPEGDDRQVDEADDHGHRRRGYPSRNLDIAIRDYAPGAEVVVDGLVYRSAGVTLNWLRPADSAEANEIQSIKTFWRCRECGSADSAHAAPEACGVCEAPIGISDRTRYLQPAGFTVDMREAPHADTDLVRYVEPEREQVVARGAAWSAFADPALGRIRATHEGLVFYSSRGAAGTGYWICLECGRAEPDGLSNTPPLHDHKPLRFTRGDEDGLCPGNGKSFKILRSIALGHDILTDVAEIQPSRLSAEGTAWALASALREALSRQLGIEIGELGMSVRKEQTALGQPTHSIFLYDRSAGGAGFASQAIPLLDELLTDAANILDCKQVGCETGCSACVLTADLYKQQDIIDRRQALVCARELIAASASPDPLDVAGPGARPSGPVADGLVAALDGARTATIWLGTELDVADLGGSAFVAFARRIDERGIMLDVIVDPEWLERLDSAARLALRDASRARPFTLRKGRAPTFANDARGVAAIDGARPRMWATRDAAAGRLSLLWGRQTLPAIVLPELKPPLAVTIDPDSLLPVGGTLFIEFPPGIIDGTIAGFGQRWAASVLPALRDLSGSLGRLSGMHYADRYLHAPLPVRLALGALAALRDALGGTSAPLPIEIATNRLKPNEQWPRRPTDNWQRDDHRAEVMSLLAKALALDLTLVEGAAPHGRVLTIHGELGSVRLILDQGFGPWATPAFARYSFADPPGDQADKLKSLSMMVAAKGMTYVVVTR